MFLTDLINLLTTRFFDIDIFLSHQRENLNAHVFIKHQLTWMKIRSL